MRTSKLFAGREALPEVGGVLQRERHLEAERGPRPLHAGRKNISERNLS